MEDWEVWQAQAAEVAAQLNADVRALDEEYLSSGDESTLRGFWPRFRDLKERVRVAPAIRLEDKLDLERKLRTMGSRAYKAQEGAYGRSAERKAELLETIGGFRERAESLSTPRELRGLRREVDAVRRTFDAGPPLVPADRQQVWDAWRAASEDVWSRLTAAWEENERHLREALDAARAHVGEGRTAEARKAIGTFVEGLRGREVRQESLNAMKAEAEAIRREVEAIEERQAADREASRMPEVPAVEIWRAELARSREAEARLQAEVDTLDQQYREAASVIEGAVVRGTLVDKKRRLSEYQRTIKTLEQRIEAVQEAPLIPVG